MANKRVPLSDRRTQDRKKGVDVLLDPEPDPVAAPAKLAKVTMYVRPEQITSIEEIQFNERKRTGKKVDKSDLFQEALDLLITKYSGKK